MADFQTLVDLFERSAERYADKELFGTKGSTGWTWTRYGELREMVDALRAGLESVGVGPGDRVAVVSTNRVEWAAAAYATYGRGAAFVPMYEAQAPEEWEFILKDSGSKVVFASSRAIYDALVRMAPRLSSLSTVVGFDLPEAESGSFRQMVAAGGRNPSPSVQPAPGDMAGLIYTSGTTGRPKGVMLTHANLCSNINAVHEIFPLDEDERSLSFLPWAHAFGQTCELHLLVSRGASMAINDEVGNLVENLAVVKPTVLFAVPRIFNRIYDGVNRQMSQKPQVVQALFRAGVRNSTRKARGANLGPLSHLSISLADKLIFEKVRARFGGRLKFVVSGSAALSLEVAQFIDALGIPVYEGYGLTETSPIATANYPGQRKVGSVGRAIPGVRVRIDASTDGTDGEIIVYGPNVMQGYYHRQEETESTLLPDGGLRTGDMGRLDDQGFLFVTGRLKEQYKLENGKYTVPGPIEDALKLSPFIDNAMVHGDGRPYNVALLVLNAEALRDWASREGVSLGAEPAADARVQALLKSEIEQRTTGFKHYERPRRFAVIREDFTPENGLLTPTLKLRRQKVVAKHQATLRGLYDQGEVSRQL